MILTFESCPKNVEHSEDGSFHHGPFFGVFDSFSPPYCQEHPQEMSDGLTAGQIVRHAVMEAIYGLGSETKILDALEIINDTVYRAQETRGLIGSADNLAGASFVLCKKEKRFIKILQGGDCLTVGIYKNGSIRFTDNPFKKYESRLRERIAELRGKTSDKKEMWNAFYSTLCNSRKTHSNEGYPILNGQKNLLHLVEKICMPCKELSMMVSLTDGLTPWSEVEGLGDKQVAETVGRFFFSERPSPETVATSFQNMLAWARKAEDDKDREKTSHASHAEATCQVFLPD